MRMERNKCDEGGKQRGWKIIKTKRRKEGMGGRRVIDVT